MSAVIVSLSLVIVICLLLIIAAYLYNKFQDYIIRINEADVNIDSVLRKRFDLLKKSIDIIKNATKTEEDILLVVNELRSSKLSNFEFDRKLYDAINEFNLYKDKYEELHICEAYIKIEAELTESESEIIALRKYYNDIVTDYNKLVMSFPSNLIATFKGYKKKEYFDGEKKGVIKL